VLNEEVVGGLGIPIEMIDAATAEEKLELKRRDWPTEAVTLSRRCAPKR
jgi:hypothetical protein